MTTPLPKAITADRSRNILKITWQDEAISEIPFEVLRDACPCATCREPAPGEEAARQDDDLLVIPILDARMYQLESLEAVGNYALNLTWSDGHKYGIYQWDYLRSLG